MKLRCLTVTPVLLTFCYPPVGGPLSRRLARGSPRGLTLRPRLPRGFLVSEQMENDPRENSLTGRENHSGSQLVQCAVMVYFSHHVDGETRQRAGSAGNRQDGDRKPKGNWRRKVRTESDWETGSGNVHPESTGNRWHRGSRDRWGSFGIVTGKPAASLKACNSTLETRKRAAFGSHSRWLRSTATSRAESGPRPDICGGIEEPREG